MVLPTTVISSFDCSLYIYVYRKSCLTLATPWSVACQAPLSVGFSRQEYWDGLPFLLRGIFPTQCILPYRSVLHHRATWEAQGPFHGWGNRHTRPLSVSEIALLCLTSKCAWCWLQGLFPKAEMIKLLFPSLSYHFQDRQLPPGAL